MIRKLLKKWGNGLGILVNKEERKIYNLEEGDVEFNPIPKQINIIFKDKEEIDWKDLRDKINKNKKSEVKG